MRDIRSDLQEQPAHLRKAQRMTDNRRLHVELDGVNIIVTMPSTSFRVAYRKAYGDSWLIASDYVRDDVDAPITRAEFLDKAWAAANDKARELGWIV
jgi:hypothetical protein